jgi:hypothetical protein
MAGLDPAIHVLPVEEKEDVDHRDKPGDDDRKSVVISTHLRLPATLYAPVLQKLSSLENGGRRECRVQISRRSDGTKRFTPWVIAIEHAAPILLHDISRRRMRWRGSELPK